MIVNYFIFQTHPLNFGYIVLKIVNNIFNVMSEKVFRFLTFRKLNIYSVLKMLKFQFQKIEKCILSWNGVTLRKSSSFQQFDLGKC